MSKLCLRLLPVAILANSAGIVLSQERPIGKTPSRAEGGNVASLEEPDFTRFRVVTGQGVLAVFDAEEDFDGRDEPYSQLAYWNDFATEQLYFFNQLLLTEADVLQAVATIQRDLGIDMAPILIEKPEFAPLPEIIAFSVWLPASESLVISVMEGGSAAADDQGQVSGLALPCVPAGGCGPAMASAASGPLSAPVRGTSFGGLFAMAQAGSGCSCGGGTPPPPDPLRYIHPIADKLGMMEDDLLSNHFDPSICPIPAVSPEVITTVDVGTYAASAPVTLHQDDQELRTGSVSVATTDGSDSVELEIATTFDDGAVGPDPEWTLNQSMTLEGDVLRFSGSISVVEPSSGTTYTLQGGWMYSETAGVVIDPSSDQEFHNALANMQGFEQPVVAGGVSPGQVLSVAINAIVMVLNYLRDSLRPYTQPTSCGGPVYEDGTTLSCEAEEIPCYAILDEIALKIHNLTNVSQAFKKCMMGRLDCRGSNNRQYSHPQIRVKCDFSHYPSCGPCIVTPDPNSNEYAAGCNLGGRHIWYCGITDTSQPENHQICGCAMVVFHEASHACGAQDPPLLPINSNYSSYRIGYWFADRYLETTTKCVGGSNDGQPCQESTDCPSGSCPSGICPR